jgi:hypothetical protein
MALFLSAHLPPWRPGFDCTIEWLPLTGEVEGADVIGGLGKVTVSWIRIRIENEEPDLDPGARKLTKINKST